VQQVGLVKHSITLLQCDVLPMLPTSAHKQAAFKVGAERVERDNGGHQGLDVEVHCVRASLVHEVSPVHDSMEGLHVR